MTKIITYPNPILRAKANEIKELDKRILDDMGDLEKMLRNCENGAGLAAQQIGLEKKFFGMKDSEVKETKVLVNPKIEKFYGERVFPKLAGEKREEDFLEGCLSFPDLYGTVRRYLKLGASWQELEKGKLVKREKEMVGFEAIVFQHELDHLNGILFVDYIKKEGGKFYKMMGKEMVEWDIKRI